MAVSERLVWELTHNVRIHGFPGLAKAHKPKGIQTSEDPIKHRFPRFRLNKFWVSDITEHPIRPTHQVVHRQSLQEDRLDLKRWTTRVDLSNSVFELPEVFGNLRRRNSKLD